jgi:Ni,Fe-hydrogenase I large subunit
MCGALSVAPRVGLGWVETARGALAHLIELDADGARIARYRILAPTEWNFHPRGALAAGLLGVHEPRRADLRRRALWLLQALDPCVEHTLRIDGERVAPEST